MKLHYLTCTAVAALAIGAAPAALAQGPDTSAATANAPAPSLNEEIVYLRDRMAVQALRLDEAEQMLQRQQQLIELQEQKIAELERSLGETARLAQSLQSGGTYVASAPAASGATVAAAGGTYTVRRGDTLSRIADRNNTTIAKLARANNLRSPYRLDIGQNLTLPGQPAPARVAAAPAEDADASKVEQPQAQQSETAPQPTRVADSAAQQEGGLPTEVGERPEEEEKEPYLAIFSDVSGIQTPKGALYVEPSIGLTTSTDGRFFLSGFNVFDTLFIGAGIEAKDTNQTAINAGIGFRYGLTNRLEVDARIPYVYRDDRVSNILLDENNSRVNNLEGSDIGDVSFGLHYQVNDGGKWPYVIANIRASAPTGTGPFEVSRDVDGLETELSTGSGYWSIEPSLTFILPSDPASIYANIGYQYNMANGTDRVLGTGPNPAVLLDFDAGDAIRTSLGVGLSVNEKLSINFGYDQSYFFETKSTFSNFVVDETTMVGSTVISNVRQPSLVVGSFVFGGSYAVNNRLRLNLNTSFGATDEAADMRVSLRAQIRVFD